jgi:hypothetical protein
MQSVFAFLGRIWRAPAVRTALLVFVVMRISTALVASWIVSAWPPPDVFTERYVNQIRPQVFLAQGALRAPLEAWYRWDTDWYVYIAYHGYTPDMPEIIFPPMYPLMIRAATILTGGDYLVAALLVSNLCTLIVLILLYTLAEQEFNNRVAAYTLILFGSFPTAFFLLAGYTEAVFLMFVLGAWLLVRQARQTNRPVLYWFAGILAFMASLARTQGWVLGLAFAYIAYIQFIEQPFFPRIWQTLRYYLQHPLQILPPLPAVLGAPLGTAVYLFGMGLGDIEAAFVREPWLTEIGAPWNTILQTINVILNGAAKPHDIGSLLVFFFVLGLGLVVMRYMSPAYWLYMFPTLFFILLRQHQVYQFHGIMRYSISMFPIFIVAVWMFQRRRWGRTALIAWVVIGGILQLLMTIWFVEWGWIS